MLNKILRVSILMFMLTFLFLPSKAETNNLIQNPSFEEPIVNKSWGLYFKVPGWRDGTFGGILEIWDAPSMGLNAPDGNQILELNSTGQHEIKQDVIVKPNTNYIFSYWHKKRVSANESTTVGIDNPDREIAQYLCTTDNFDWNLCQFEFNSQDSYMITVIILPNTVGVMGNLIDNVSLIEIPGPEPTETIEPTPTETVEPTPTETLEPTPTETETSSGSPTPTVEPSVLPSPSDDPSPSLSTAVPEPSYSESLATQPEIIVPSPTPPTQEEEPTAPEVSIIPEDSVMLENGVILKKDVAESLQILDSPKAIIAAIFTNPTKIFKALGNVGADMPPKKRKKAQTVVFPVIIVSSVIAGTTNILTRGRVK